MYFRLCFSFFPLLFSLQRRCYTKASVCLWVLKHQDNRTKTRIPQQESQRRVEAASDRHHLLALLLHQQLLQPPAHACQPEHLLHRHGFHDHPPHRLRQVSGQRPALRHAHRVRREEVRPPRPRTLRRRRRRRRPPRHRRPVRVAQQRRRRRRRRRLAEAVAHGHAGEPAPAQRHREVVGTRVRRPRRRAPLRALCAEAGDGDSHPRRRRKRAAAHAEAAGHQGLEAVEEGLRGACVQRDADVAQPRVPRVPRRVHDQHPRVVARAAVRAGRQRRGRRQAVAVALRRGRRRRKRQHPPHLLAREVGDGERCLVVVVVVVAPATTAAPVVARCPSLQVAGRTAEVGRRAGEQGLRALDVRFHVHLEHGVLPDLRRLRHLRLGEEGAAARREEGDGDGEDEVPVAEEEGVPDDVDLRERHVVREVRPQPRQEDVLRHLELLDLRPQRRVVEGEQRVEGAPQQSVPRARVAREVRVARQQRRVARVRQRLVVERQRCERRRQRRHPLYVPRGSHVSPRDRPLLQDPAQLVLPRLRPQPRVVLVAPRHVLRDLVVVFRRHRHVDPVVRLAQPAEPPHAQRRRPHLAPQRRRDACPHAVLDHLHPRRGVPQQQLPHPLRPRRLLLHVRRRRLLRRRRRRQQRAPQRHLLLLAAVLLPQLRRVVAVSGHAFDRVQRGRGDRVRHGDEPGARNVARHAAPPPGQRVRQRCDAPARRRRRRRAQRGGAEEQRHGGLRHSGEHAAVAQQRQHALLARLHLLREEGERLRHGRLRRGPRSRGRRGLRLRPADAEEDAAASSGHGVGRRLRRRVVRVVARRDELLSRAHERLGACVEEVLLHRLEAAQHKPHVRLLLEVRADQRVHRILPWSPALLQPPPQQRVLDFLRHVVRQPRSGHGAAAATAPSAVQLVEYAVELDAAQPHVRRLHRRLQVVAEERVVGRLLPRPPRRQHARHPAPPRLPRRHAARAPHQLVHRRPVLFPQLLPARLDRGERRPVHPRPPRRHRRHAPPRHVQHHFVAVVHGRRRRRRRRRLLLRPLLPCRQEEGREAAHLVVQRGVLPARGCGGLLVQQLDAGGVPRAVRRHQQLQEDQAERPRVAGLAAVAPEVPALAEDAAVDGGVAVDLGWQVRVQCVDGFAADHPVDQTTLVHGGKGVVVKLQVAVRINDEVVRREGSDDHVVGVQVRQGSHGLAVPQLGCGVGQGASEGVEGVQLHGERVRGGGGQQLVRGGPRLRDAEDGREAAVAQHPAELADEVLELDLGGHGALLHVAAGGVDAACVECDAFAVHSAVDAARYVAHHVGGGGEGWGTRPLCSGAEV
eukprot:Rhum_TRINITY_DN13174_c1_g1::Rhum_TRINITY_DN13174_c1_g1_i1::g.57598::m.57598